MERMKYQVIALDTDGYQIQETERATLKEAKAAAHIMFKENDEAARVQVRDYSDECLVDLYR